MSPNIDPILYEKLHIDFTQIVGRFLKPICTEFTQLPQNEKLSPIMGRNSMGKLHTTIYNIIILNHYETFI